MRLVYRLLSASLALLLFVPTTSAFAVQAVSFSGANTGLIAGFSADEVGFVSSSADGGKSWSATRFKGKSMRAVAAEGAGGWAAAEWIGELWGSPTGVLWSPTPTGGDQTSPKDVALLASGRVAVIGSEGNPIGAGITGSIRVTDDDGATWTVAHRGPIYQPADEFSEPPEVRAEFEAIDATADGQVAWVIGNEFNPDPITYKRGLALRTVDGGSTWTTATAAVPSTGGNAFADVAAVDANTMFAVGVTPLSTNGFLLKTTNGGATTAGWTLQLGMFDSSNARVAPFTVDARRIGGNTVVLVGANAGRVGISTDGGNTFTYKKLGASTAIIRDVQMITDTHWIAVGDNETIYRTEDSGNNWTGTTGLKAPAVSITSPTSTTSLVGANATISGSAGDGAGVGVSAVELTIRGEDGRYFNGSTWQTAEKWLPAGNGGAWKTWSYTLPLGSRSGQGFDIAARVTDGLGLTGYHAVSGIVVQSDRLSGSHRYAASTAIARDAYDTDPARSGTQWDVTDIVIASGEDRAAADPLAAAGLCGVYDAPLFLVSSKAVDTTVRAAVKEIAAAAGGPVNVHIVGGTVSVPDARFNDLVAAVGTSGTLVKQRVVTGGDRYSLAAAIARKMRTVTGTTPSTVLIANGADSTKFFDALALSPIAAHNAYPILLVSATAVPTATQRYIDDFKPAKRVVGGGPVTVNETVRAKLGATRWYGANRYTTSTVIADKGVGEANMSRATVGIASTLPYALLGGAAVGRTGGVLVVTNGAALTSTTGSWLSTHKAQIGRAIVFGDSSSPTGSVKSAIDTRLK